MINNRVEQKGDDQTDYNSRSGKETFRICFTFSLNEFVSSIFQYDKYTDLKKM